MKRTLIMLASMALAAFPSCQDSDDAYMTLETKTLAMATEGGVATVSVAANVFYRVNNDCSTDGESYWATIESTETQGSTTRYTITVKPNTAIETRTGTIRFIGDNVTPLKLTISQKGDIPKGISPQTASVEGSETTATFKVFGESAWKATCADQDVTVSPAGGMGDGEVTLTFPVNMKRTPRTIRVNVELEGDATYTYTLTQGAFSGTLTLADWDLKALTAQTKETFAAPRQTEFPGTNGNYVAASKGNGKIEYWAAVRTGYVEKTAYCERSVGGNGDPYISGAIPEDYWLITADLGGEVIPAGTKIHFSFVTKLGVITSNYWMISFKDGSEWAPALPTSTRTESATKTVSGASINYSATITYNWSGMLLDGSQNGAYIPAEGTFTTTKDMTEIQLKFQQAGHLGLGGSKNYNGLYNDVTHASGQTRFSAQQPSNPDGSANTVYDQHVLLEIVE